MSEGILSQDEINALLAGGPMAESEVCETSLDGGAISQREADAIGEVGNICLGSAATALARLLDRKVAITTPAVSMASEKDISGLEGPQLLVSVEYIEGIKGVSVFLLPLSDAAAIADVMMGGSGVDPAPIDDIRLSAVGEAMNQMMGSASTAMAAVLQERVGISTPFVRMVDFSQEEDRQLIEGLNGGDDNFVETSFRLTVEDVVSSEFIQLMPVEFSKRLVEAFYQGTVASVEAAPALETVEAPAPMAAPVTPVRAGEVFPTRPNEGGSERMAGDFERRGSGVSVQAAEFAPLTGVQAGRQSHNMHLLMDVPLQVTVELGRTKMLIKEILELGKGSLVELEKFAGEPVDVLVNGKVIAKGEVVVIDENFGVKIVEIVTPVERVNNLQ